MRIPLSGLLLIVLSFSVAQTPTRKRLRRILRGGGQPLCAGASVPTRRLTPSEQALRINPELAGAHLGLGSAYHNMGRLADALGPLTAAVGLEPQNAVAHLNLGITLAALRRPEDAMIELNEAKRLNPQSAESITKSATSSITASLRLMARLRRIRKPRGWTRACRPFITTSGSC